MSERLTRRQLLTRATAGAVGFSAFWGVVRAGLGGDAGYVTPDSRRRGLIRPPGSAEEPELLARCIRCQRCAEVCETDALRYAGSWAGEAAGTPYLVPEDAACDLCLACGTACPTGAILPLSDKREARMGLAVVDKRLCVSHNGTGVCGACFTICPLKGKAIKQGAHNAPEILEGCVGCGLCEEACIVDDPKAGRAIRVRSERAWS